MAKRSRVKKEKTSETPGKSDTGQTLSAGLSRDWLQGLLLLLAVLLVYQPVWYAGFIWDDDVHVTANPCIVGPLGLADIWTTSTWRSFPLVITAFWMEHAVWGVAPLPYHLVNVLEHGACAVLLWRVLRGLQVPGAWLGAALWALHPVQVESVAWISEMKNTQSCLFYLLTILFYVRWLRSEEGAKRGEGNYDLAVLCAAAAMASKSSTMVLPVVLALCAWWVKGRWPWRYLAPLVPILLLSAVFSTITLWPQTTDLAAGPANPEGSRSGPERVATAGFAIWFYLGKLLWPHPLMMVYPRWQIDAGQWFSYLPLLAAILGLTILWLKRESRFRPCFFAFFYFVLVLSPFLGLVDQSFWRYSFVQDHLPYLACLGPLALAGAGLVWASARVAPGQRWLQAMLCACPLLILGALSWQRAWVYVSQETLWTDTLAKNPNCWVGYDALGNDLIDKGRVGEATALFQKALEINPQDVAAANNLGGALLQGGRVDKAVTQYQNTLKINPDDVAASNNLGDALLQRGRVNEAVAQLQKALEMDPHRPEVRNNLGNALLQNGQVDEALAQYQKALEIDPNYLDARNNLGNAFIRKGQVDEAIGQYQKALEINSNYDQAHNNLGYAFLEKGRIDEAMAEFQRALEINPNYGDAHNNLGIVLIKKGQLVKAVIEFQEAARLNPDDASAQGNLAKAKALVAQRTPSK